LSTSQPDGELWSILDDGSRLSNLETAMALGPTSRALQYHDPETRAAVATSISRALQPYQRGKQVALAGAIWLVTANNA
jgi:hypothetical protein